MTYFSMENGRYNGNSHALALFHMTNGPKPLIYGLFGGMGRSLVFLSDAIELGNHAVLMVESLVLAATDWKDSIHETLTQEIQHDHGLLAPSDLINRIAYDGRLSGVMKSGQGFHGICHVWSNQGAKAAIQEYVHRLDCRDLTSVLKKLSDLSVLLCCATHKAGNPAFDYYLGHLPTLVNSIRILLGQFVEHRHRVTLVRGLWLLMILLYITQLRPVLDKSLLRTSGGLPGDEVAAWYQILVGFHDHRGFQSEDHGEGNGRWCTDMQLLRLLRSLWELGKAFDGKGTQLYIRAAWKLHLEWRGWTGLGADGEDVLNIRL